MIDFKQVWIDAKYYLRYIGFLLSMGPFAMFIIMQSPKHTRTEDVVFWAVGFALYWILVSFILTSMFS